MSAPTPRAHIAPAADLEAEPSSQATYQARLGTTFAALTAIVFVSNVILWAAYAAFPSVVSRVLTPAIKVSTSRLAVLAIAWLVCRYVPLRTKQRDRVEVGFTLLTMTLSSLPVAFHPKELRDDGLLTIIFLFCLLALRAGLVPAAPRRATQMAVIAATPLLVAAIVRCFVSFDGDALSVLINVVYWGTAGIALTRVVAQRISTLRKEVREAQRYGQYTLEEQLGQGGMGEVYRARHAFLRRPAAIKVLRPDMSAEEDVIRFEREVQATSRLRHPNTVSIFDYGRTVDQGFYYVMELLEGFDLHRLVMQTGPLPPARVIHILQQVCASLSEAHMLGLVHRDIKPANILLVERPDEPDVVKVVDFGLVKTRPAKEDLDESQNKAVGTPAYMAPETILGRGTTAQSDLYAVGAVGYYLLSGQHAFGGESPREVLAKHLLEMPAPISKIAKVPADLAALITRCLAKEPAERPATAERLRRELLACADAPRYDRDAAREWWRDHPPRLGHSPDVPTIRQLSVEMAPTLRDRE